MPLFKLIQSSNAPPGLLNAPPGLLNAPNDWRLPVLLKAYRKVGIEAVEIGEMEYGRIMGEWLRWGRLMDRENYQ